MFMNNQRSGVVTMVALAVIGMWGFAPIASADVNLEWRPMESEVAVGQVVAVGLFAVSDIPDTDEPIAALDVLASWNTDFLLFQGVINNSPYSWLNAYFPDDSAGDALNTTFLDGDAKFTALAQFGAGNEAYATPEGLLVTTFEFLALQETPVGDPTEVEIMMSFGTHSNTAVRRPGNIDATGDFMMPATVTIIPEPAAGVLMALAATLLRRRRRAPA